MIPADRITRIDRAVDAVLLLFEGLPSEALYRPPAPGEWPVMSTLAHLAEMLPYWAGQCRAMVERPADPIGRELDDAQRVGAIEQHGQDALAIIEPMLRASRDQAVSILRGLPAGAWTIVGRHRARGAMTVEQVVDVFVVGHLEDHAAQIRRALQALGYSPSQVP